MSIFDAIDRRFRAPKKPEIKLDAHQSGQDCPNPKCRGKLAWHGVNDAIEAGGSYLACDDPGCGWRETSAPSGALP